MSGTTENQTLDSFARCGLRNTRQRLAIYDALCATTAHPTADELYRGVRRNTPGISLATVYNTLEVFCRAGLAVRLAGNGTSAHYDATVANHLHTRCERSGQMRDVPSQLGRQVLDRIPKELLDQIESDLGFRIRQVQVELVGEYT